MPMSATSATSPTARNARRWGGFEDDLLKLGVIPIPNVCARYGQAGGKP
jgi:hypothetical protein